MARAPLLDDNKKVAGEYNLTERSSDVKTLFKKMM